MVHVCPECLSCINHVIAEDEIVCDKCENVWHDPLPTHEQQVLGFIPESLGWVKLQEIVEDEK